MPLRAWHIFLLVMAPPNFPNYYTSVSAQSDAMSLITLAPPTSIASTTADAAAASTAASSAQAAPSNTITTISYPSGAPTLNYGDTLLVSYDTPWNAPNLVVFCNKPSGFASYSALNIPPSGSYNLSPVQGSLGLSSFPANCHINLADSSNSANEIDGGDFILTSTIGAVKTYGATATITGSSPAASNTASTEASPAQSRKSTPTANSSSSPASTPNSADSASSTSPSSSTSSSTLSPGAKAGIAIAVLLILGLLIAAFFLYRRQRQRYHTKLSAMQTQLDTVHQERATEKAYFDSILTAAGKLDTEHGGKIVRENDVRQSGDWRRFFGSKAASAAGSVAGAAAVVGAVISNSRPGSRRASMARSRLGTSDGKEKEKEKDLPAVPALPTPTPTEGQVQKPWAAAATATATAASLAVPPSPTVTVDSNSVNGTTDGGRTDVVSEMGEARSTTGLIPQSKKK